ncbi:hypothetical protein TrRE_jg8324 [Triparma retinervis]|uniref:E3 ubiquitin protein ligase n=1 Tax=Triparma retinervis TaxID=2557542 RepID=A0A9W7ANS4_9STRA|nr:hypothetical protein TrRE_jg8324 [Triparma retinervis]
MKRTLKRAQSDQLEVEESNPPTKSLRTTPPPVAFDYKSLLDAEIERSGEEPDGWFLKHMNRGMATEMQKLKRLAAELEEEREARRVEVQSALSSVNDFTASWVGLEVALSALLGDNKVVESVLENELKSNGGSPAAPATASTGCSSSVEPSTALLEKIARTLSTSEAHDAVELLPQGASTSSDLASATSALSKRSHFVATGVASLLEKATKASPVDLTGIAQGISKFEKMKVQEATIVELSASRDKFRDDAKRSQRKLDKLAAGVPAEEILRDTEKVVGGDSNGGTSAASAAATSSSGANSPGPASSTMTTASAAATPVVPSAQMDEVKKISEHRKAKIEVLEKQLTTLKKDLNVANAAATRGTATVAEHQVKSHPLYSAQSASLAMATSNLKVAEDNFSALSEKFAQMKGKLNLAEKSLGDLTQTSNNQVNELLEEKQKKCAGLEATVAKLKFKLNQAVEGGRQALSIKSSMAEMKTLVETLTTQNKKLQKQVDAHAKKAALPPPPNPKSPPSVEELLVENSSLRSQLSDSENLMNEIDSLEQERDLLAKTNARLQKQALDKEDRNNNSMSEMLKFKQLHDQAKDENVALNEQIKKAEEVSNAARAVEMMCKNIEQELKNKTNKAEELEARLQKDISKEKAERLKAEASLAEAKNATASTDASSSQMQKRADELVNEVADCKAAKNHLEEQLVCCKAERDRALEQAANSTGSGDRMLELQVKNLKSKITCHVCNDKEKNVILKSCNHMFCSSCITTRLENRDRKCPACGKKFTQKDVTDIWLTG